MKSLKSFKFSNRIVWLMMVLILLAWAVTARAEEMFWTGWHVSLGQVQQDGENKLAYTHDWVGQVPFWEIPVKAQSPEISAGYRWSLGKTPLTLGFVGSLTQGPLTGSLSWSDESSEAEVVLTYNSEFVASLGAEAGFVLSHEWLLTTEIGFAAAMAELVLDASIHEYAGTWSETGYLPGRYYAIRLTRQLPSGLTFGFEIGQQTFSISEPEWGGVATLRTTAPYVGVNIGWQF